MQYMYAVMWCIIGLILICSFGKENKIFYATGGFFLFLGGWWAADAVVEVNLFASPWIWILRGVTVLILIPLVILFARNYMKNSKKSSGRTPKDGGDRP